jgi:hypothetical protein
MIERVYDTFGIGDYSPDGGQTFQPITIQGQVRSIREPSTVVLAGMGFLGLVVFGQVCCSGVRDRLHRVPAPIAVNSPTA